MNQTRLLEQLLTQFTKENLSHPRILRDCCSGDLAAEYEKSRQVFNSKFQFRPAAIFLVTTTEQVASIVRFAKLYPLLITLRVRSGGHDHEGECSGTDVWLIDFSLMKSVSRDDAASDKLGIDIVAIQPGARFYEIKPILDAMCLSIPHGTCESVGVTGYTLGGGWGPWTRRYGMGCERLIGATIVLGDGSIKKVSALDSITSTGGKLLWALRGGGGFSYGIVTELRFHAFKLPEELHSFNIKFVDKKNKPDCRAIDILKNWERVIAGKRNPKLIGTNLMIQAAHIEPDQAPDPNAKLICFFNGYFSGSEQEVRELIGKYFGEQYLHGLQIQVHAAITQKNTIVRTKDWHFSSWDRVVELNVSAKIKNNPIQPSIALELDGPAPHKITSRLCNPQGWNNASRKALICALQSPLVASQQIKVKHKFSMHQYITIGAISGSFYGAKESDFSTCAFPYADRPFTLQFQAWWDQYLNKDGEPVKHATPEAMETANLANRHWANRAEDWIANCRDAFIPATSGAFISFKDDAVSTETYFSQHYETLRRVKTDCSRDPNLLFKSRKTIL